ncbi:MAG: LysM peptidoglycan-binding domain-containing protein [Clostridiaceae bacterium]|jgi:LysM repeat protein|nr:LysM peptidoglycan-binding domain-containing protein [Clostridiaceae bacterium]
MKTYRLKNKKRFFTFLLLLFSVIVLFVGSVVSAGENLKKEYKTVTVRQGDTLWGIASEHRGNMDIRQYIYQIKKINNLEDAIIYAGQKLNLP